MDDNRKIAKTSEKIGKVPPGTLDQIVQIIPRRTTKGRSYYYFSGRQKDNSKTIADTQGMAKMPYLIHGNPSFQNILFGETKIVLKPMVFTIFYKQAISKKNRSSGLDIALFDNEKHVCYFFSKFVIKNVFS